MTTRQMRPATMAAMRLAGALIVGVVTLPASNAPVFAETYPTRPITIMVGFSPGGPTDTFGRIIAAAMQGSLGQPVVVETVLGGGRSIAPVGVARAGPDGYTIGIGQWTSHVASPAIYPLDYDILRDLQPIALLAGAPLWIVGKEALPPKTMPELITWIKARPQPTTFGTV